MSDMCHCWTSKPAVLHSGHCCFMDDPRPLDEIVPGETLCGHWHPDVPRPNRDDPTLAKAVDE